MSRGTFDVVVIGGGQAGIAAGDRLAAAGIPFVILDANAEAGDPWRRRWPTLELFTPARHSSLPGLPMPEPAGAYPTAAEMAAYLSSYVRERALPYRSGVTVTRVRPRDDGFDLETSGRPLRARRVIVATGAYRDPFVPELAAGLSSSVAQLHSRDYRGPESVTGSPVVVVGTGSSGLQIAIDLATAGREVTLAGRKNGSLPRRVLGADVYDWLYGLPILSIPRHSALGRRVIERTCRTGDRLLGQNLAAAAREFGLRRVLRIRGVENDELVDVAGERTRAQAIVWATGYRNRWDWIDAPVTDARGELDHRRGRAVNVPGLFFVGQPGMHHLGSSLIGFAGRDAEIVVGELERTLG
jgi:putative flavoprotein involved in K+ transport